MFCQSLVQPLLGMDVAMEPMALDERISRLERSNARLTTVAVLFAIGLFALVSTGAGQDRAKTIDVERILLRDPSGKLQAELRACTGESGFVICDPEENDRLRLRCSGDGSTTLSLTPRAGRGTQRRIDLHAGSNGWSWLSFSDANDQRLTLGLAYDGEPQLRMYNRDREPRVGLGSDMSGRAELVVHDASGNERLVLRASPDGSPTLKLYDGEGHAVFSAPQP